MRQWLSGGLCVVLLSTSFGWCEPVSVVGADDTVMAQAAANVVRPPLTLEDVLRRVESYHPKLKAADLQRRLASAERLEKQGAFDPALAIQNDTQRYNKFPERGEAKFETLTDVELGMLTRYGAKLSANADYHYGYIKSPASGTGDTGTYFLGIQLPLLRGAGINEKSAAERKALIGEPLANAEFFEYRIGLLYKAASVYWDWVAAKLTNDAAQAALNIARDRAAQVQQRAEAGDLAWIDSVEAEQAVQKRQESVLKVDRGFQKSTFSLANMLWNSIGTEVIRPTAEQVPATLPEPTPYDAARTQQAKVIALRQRPELSQIELLKGMRDVDLDFAKNQLLPILDLYAGPGYDTGNQSIGPTFKAGISVVVPLRNRSARGQIEQAKLKLQKLDFEQQTMVQQVLLEVDDTASQLNMLYQRYQAAKQAYKLAHELEVGERTKFELGDSTLFLVNQRELAAMESQIKMIELQADFQKALVQMQAVTGQL